MNNIQEFADKYESLTQYKVVNEVKNALNLIQKTNNPKKLSMLCEHFEERIRSIKLPNIEIQDEWLQALNNNIKNISDLKIYNKLEESILRTVTKPIIIEKITNHFIDLKENNKIIDQKQIDASTKFVQELLSYLCKTEKQKVALDKNAKEFVKGCVQEVGTIEQETSTIKSNLIEKIKNLCQEFLSCVFPYMKTQDHKKPIEIEGILNSTEIQHITKTLKQHVTSASEGKTNKDHDQHHKNIGRSI